MYNQLKITFNNGLFFIEACSGDECQPELSNLICENGLYSVYKTFKEDYKDNTNPVLLELDCLNYPNKYFAELSNSLTDITGYITIDLVNKRIESNIQYDTIPFTVSIPIFNIDCGYNISNDLQALLHLIYRQYVRYKTPIIENEEEQYLIQN